ncbi:MAG: hypothetical protein IJU21_03705 [Bacteroidales bacterium]|nr:hypothetical protein [Bacteroidales bacterium]
MQHGAQGILEQFRKDYLAEGERAAVEKAALWLEAHPGEMEALTDPDAGALLWAYYGWEGEEDLAWEWRDKAIDAGSPLMQQMIEDDAEAEVGEDDWTEAEENDAEEEVGEDDWTEAEEDEPEEEEDWEQEFEAFDDETEAGG